MTIPMQPKMPKNNRRLQLRNNTHFVEFPDTARGFEDIKRFRKEHPQFKRRHIREVLRLWDDKIETGVIYRIGETPVGTPQIKYSQVLDYVKKWLYTLAEDPGNDMNTFVMGDGEKYIAEVFKGYGAGPSIRWQTSGKRWVLISMYTVGGIYDGDVASFVVDVEVSTAYSIGYHKQYTGGDLHDVLFEAFHKTQEMYPPTQD